MEQYKRLEAEDRIDPLLRNVLPPRQRPPPAIQQHQPPTQSPRQQSPLSPSPNQESPSVTSSSHQESPPTTSSPPPAPPHQQLLPAPHQQPQARQSPEPGQKRPKPRPANKSRASTNLSNLDERQDLFGGDLTPAVSPHSSPAPKRSKGARGTTTNTQDGTKKDGRRKKTGASNSSAVRKSTRNKA